MALSIRHSEPMWTFPQKNYCSLLTNCTLYSAPFTPDRSSVTLAIVTNRKQISDWPPVLLRQLISSMSLELRQVTRSHIRQKTESIHLTARQRTILLRIAGGMTDRQIAADLHITQETVQYHKKNLYRQLDAENAVRAVVKALQLGLLSLEDLPVWRTRTAETGRILHRSGKTTEIRELKKLCVFYIISMRFEPKTPRISPGSSQVR